MTNKNEVIQDAIPDIIDGQVRIGVPKGGENTAMKRAQKHIDQAWEILKTRHKWQIKYRELEMQAKKMWMDALFNQELIGKITSLFKGGA